MDGVHMEQKTLHAKALCREMETAMRVTLYYTSWLIHR